jgi:hypothetical protein
MHLLIGNNWCGVSASGNFATPILVYLNSRMSPQLGTSGSVGEIYFRTKTWWINEEWFSHWLRYFPNCVKLSEDDTTFQAYHILSWICNYCRDNGIIVVSVRPHTSNHLQPLDLRFMNTWQLLAARSEICTWEELIHSFISILSDDRSKASSQNSSST